MNILVLAWKDEAHPRAGGSERYVGELVRRWAADGERVTLFTGTAAGIAAHERVDGVDVVRRGSRLGVYREARRFFAAHGRRFDVVLEVVNTRPFGVPTWPERPPVVALIHQLAADVWDAELPTPLAAVGRYWLEPRWLRAYHHTSSDGAKG